MTLHDLQKFIETHVPGACVPVDLLQIAKSVGFRKNINRGGWRQSYNESPLPLSLVVDGECCLDRLYGGFFSDWVCGGQWNRMVQFLAVLIQTVRSNNIELAVFFNGALENQRISEWAHQQEKRRENINSVLRHVNMKGTPPPKMWWVGPTGLRMCLRMALRHLNIQVVSTMDDHHQEVIAFCRENSYHGLMAEDAEYIIFDPPRYFSSRQLKLTYKGSLETKEFILDEVAKGVGLPSNYFCLLAALLGNYLLTQEDLLNFYNTIIPGYDKEKTSQEDVIRAVVSFISHRCDVNNLMTIGAQIFGSVSDPRVSKFKESVQYFLNGTKDGFLRYKPFPQGGRRDLGLGAQQQRGAQYSQGSSGISDNDASASPSPIPSNPLPAVPHEVTRTASERHQKGLMCPWIYQVLNQGEVKIEPSFHSDSCQEFPNPVIFFRPIRQYIYGILFNLHHHSFMTRKAKEEGQKVPLVPSIRIREWIYTKENPCRTPVIVDAIPINWAVPTVQRLWFGSINDDKKRRLRAFLSCLNSDTPLMLHTGYVPQHMLIMATVLRYMMTNGDGPILRRQELDAFLVSAFSPELSNAEYLQELQIPALRPRCLALSSLLMTGVEVALFANDACGCPIPWPMCCPWLFFDGKLFHEKWMRAHDARSLMEVCEGDVELVEKVDLCREAILQDIDVKFLPYHVAMPVPLGPKPPFNNAPVHPRHPPPPMGRGRVMNGECTDNLYARGGQLEIAGVVVGQWGPNYGTGNVPRGRGTSRYVGSSSSNSNRGRIMPSSTNATRTSARGRPTVLVKRRLIKKREIRITKTPTLEYEGNSVSINEAEKSPEGVGPYGKMSDEDELIEGMSNLTPYPGYSNGSSNSNSGLKSPDSGVNVSILE